MRSHYTMILGFVLAGCGGAQEPQVSLANDPLRCTGPDRVCVPRSMACGDAGTAECASPPSTLVAAAASVCSDVRGGKASCASPPSTLVAPAGSVCSDANGGKASCASPPATLVASANSVCADVDGGRATCAKACNWKPVTGNHAIAAGPAQCFARNVTGTDTAFRIVKKVSAEDDKNCCATNDQPCDVEQTHVGSLGPTGRPGMLRVDIPAGWVACVQAGRFASVACDPGCMQ